MSSFTYRPPWPDELARLKALLPPQALGPGWRPRVWEAPRPARFIGAAGWHLAKDQPLARLFLRFQPRFETPALALEMLRPLFAELAQAGAREALVTLGMREKWAGVLGAFGLAWTHADEFWQIDAAAGRARLAASRLHAHPAKLRGWTVRPLAEGDWELVRRWAVEPGLVARERWEQLRAQHAADISGVAETPRGAGALLVAVQAGEGAVLEFLGGDPAQPRLWPVATHLLLSRLFATEAPTARFDTLVMTTNPAKGGAAHALARRSGMRQTGLAHHFRGVLTPLAE